MCEPVSITMGALGVAGAVAGGMADADAAQAQAEYNRRLSIYNNKRYDQAVEYQQALGEWQTTKYEMESASITDNANAQYQTVLKRIDQSRTRTLEDISKAGRQSAQAQSFVDAQASNTATTGNSVAIAKQQYALAEARFSNIAFNNMKNQLAQEMLNMKSIQAQSQSALNNAMPSPMAPIESVAPTQHVQAPSMLPTLLNAGSSVVGAYAYQQNLDASRGLGGTGLSTSQSLANWQTAPIGGTGSNFNFSVGPL